MTDVVERVTDAELALHEALRRSHCDHRYSNDPKHQCVGRTIITASGVTLDCTLCGTAKLRDRIAERTLGYARYNSIRQDTKRHLNVLNSALSKALFNLMSRTEEIDTCDEGDH